MRLMCELFNTLRHELFINGSAVLSFKIKLVEITVSTF